MSTFEIQPDLCDLESDLDYNSEQDEQPHQHRLSKVTSLLKDITNVSPLWWSFVWNKPQYSMTTIYIYNATEELPGGAVCGNTNVWVSQPRC